MTGIQPIMTRVAYVTTENTGGSLDIGGPEGTVQMRRVDPHGVVIRPGGSQNQGARSEGMKVTDEMEKRFIRTAYGEHDQITANVTAGLEAVLAEVPDAVPFAFAGYEDNPVFLHPCGTVTDAKEGTDLWAQVQAGECDCENTSPWMRIYVERPSA